MVIDAFVRRIIDEGAPRVVIDPHPENRVAILAYEKAGFRALGVRTTECESVLIMIRDAGR